MVRRTRMPLRSSLFDQRQEPTWIVAENSWHKILEMRSLPAGSDLMTVFIRELLRYHEQGWRLNEFSAFSASFYATKEYEDKRYVYITPVDPATPRKVHGNLM
jgi:hypothetical protein